MMYSLILALMNLSTFETSVARLDGFQAEKTCQTMADELTADAKKKYGDAYSFVAVCVEDKSNHDPD